MYAQFIILFLTLTANKCDEDLEFRIGLPEYICDKDGGIRDISNDMTKIRLLGKDAQNVNYKFDINYKRIGSKCHNNQRCTLLVWKAIRELDHYLKTYPIERLQSGLVEINNTMFMPGIQYHLNVTITKDGTVVEKKELSLDYVDDDVKNLVQKPMASLFLLGPDNSYAYATYVLNAEVNICSNISSYHFKWEFLDETGNVTFLPFKGSELKIPPDTFQSLQTYTIKSDLVADDASIANAQQTVKILSKGITVRLPFKALTAKTGQPLRIRAYVRDFDNMPGDMRLSWSCIDLDNNETCESQSDTSELEMDSGFQKPGKFKVSLEASKSEFAESASCTVEVMENIPVVEIEDFENPANPVAGFEIRATVYGLKSFCTLQWLSLEEEGFEFLNLDTVPGNVADIVNITLKEDLFLEELEEFSNGTIDQKLNLIIPPPQESWEGLKGDVKYLLRLLIKCPASTDYDNLNETEPVITETIASDVIIETNAPPKMGELQVTPPEGDAFVTSFSFKTQKAEDKSGDEPILYKFGFVLGNRDVILWNLADITDCEATLPYFEEGIQTFLECCDNFNSCGRSLGPLIKTKLPEGDDIQKIMQMFDLKMKAQDYPKAFNTALMIFTSYKTAETRDLISERINTEIETFLRLVIDENHQRSASDLIRNINEFSVDLELPENTLNKLIELRNKLSDESEKYTQRKLLSFEHGSMSLQDVRNFIEVSELIITTSNDSNKINLEKENVRKQVNNYMEKLCFNMKKAQFQLELKTLILSVEKLNKNSLNNFISIPFEGNSWQAMARIKLGDIFKSSKQSCVGKAIFRNYLGKNGVIYYAQIFNGGEINQSNEILVYLPKNKSLEESKPHVNLITFFNKQNIFFFQCIVYRDGWHSDCKIVQNIANYVKCSCKYLGYYYLEYTQTSVSTVKTKTALTTPIPVFTEKVMSSNESMGLTYQENPKEKYETVSYMVIVASLIGIIVLAVILRKIFHDDDDDNDETETFEFPKYAQLHNEEYLNDAHI